MVDERTEKEAEDFDLIALERFNNKQRPEISGKWENNYYYNSIWRNSIYFNEEYGPIIDWIIEKLETNNITNIAEFGCGTGWLTLHLAHKGFKIVGYDISAKSIEIAQNYFQSLPNKNQLELDYKKLNICDFDNYNGESIVCFGFLHHLPNEILQERINFIHNKMNPGQLLIAVEPRYDFVNFEMAFLIQALRMALPNHYSNNKDYKNFYDLAYNVYRELGELDHEQSTLDNESPSKLILDTIKKNYNDVEIKYTTAFYDKFIGSLRLNDEDNEKIAVILKKLDNIIVNYNNSFARNVILSATKT